MTSPTAKMRSDSAVCSARFLTVRVNNTWGCSVISKHTHNTQARTHARWFGSALIRCQAESEWHPPQVSVRLSSSVARQDFLQAADASAVIFQPAFFTSPMAPPSTPLLSWPECLYYSHASPFYFPPIPTIISHSLCNSTAAPSTVPNCFLMFGQPNTEAKLQTVAQK